MAKAKRRTHRPDSVLHYLRSIDAKLDRLNKQLDKFLSAPKRKRAARTGDAGDPEKRALVSSTSEAAEEYLKMHPGDADDDNVIVVITGVPRANEPH